MLAYQLLLFHSLKQLLPKKQTGKSEFTKRIHLKSPKVETSIPKAHILHLCLRNIHSNPLQFCRFFLPFVTPRQLEWLRTSPRQGPVMLARAARPAVQCRGTAGQIERAMPSSHGGEGDTLLQKEKLNELKNPLLSRQKRK